MTEIQAFSLASYLPPFHEIRLPTSGLYDVDIPEKVSVRGLTVKELKQITANGKLDKKIFDSVISSCIKEKINISKLPIEDYNYIVYMIRLHSNGPTAASVTRCEDCGKHFKFDFNILDSVAVEYCNNAIEKTKTIQFDRFLLTHGHSIFVEVKRLTRGDVINVENNIRIQTELAAKEGRPKSVYPLVEYLKAYIISISGFPTHVPKELILDILNSEETTQLTKAFDDEKFGVSGAAIATCPFCGKDNTYDIPFTDIFFL